MSIYRYYRNNGSYYDEMVNDGKNKVYNGMAGKEIKARNTDSRFYGIGALMKTPPHVTRQEPAYIVK